MANAEFEQLKEALRKAPTEEARKASAEAMRRYLEKRAKGSKPTLVSLGYKKTYPHAIELKNIPQELERNPAFFELLSRVIGKTKND